MDRVRLGKGRKVRRGLDYGRGLDPGGEDERG